MGHASVAVVGTVCCDEIRRPGKRPEFSYGGIYYTLVTLAQLLGDNGSIIPICKIGAREYPAVIGELRRYPAISHEYERQYPGRNNTVLLDYYSDEERIEYSTNLPKPFTIKELVPIPDVKIFLVNFVSGIEMTNRTFRALKHRLNIPLFVDLHSIFLGFKRNGERFYVRNRNWSAWHESGDIVQMNRIEAQILAGRVLTHDEDFVSFGRFLLDRGASVVLITKGSEGSFVLWKSGKRSLHRSIPAYSFGDSLNPTGCGDVFSSAYVSCYLQGADPPEAADFASKVAGIRAAKGGSAELHNLRRNLEKENVITMK